MECENNICSTAHFSHRILDDETRNGYFELPLANSSFENENLKTEKMVMVTLSCQRSRANQMSLKRSQNKRSIYSAVSLPQCRNFGVIVCQEPWCFSKTNRLSWGSLMVGIVKMGEIRGLNKNGSGFPKNVYEIQIFILF